MEKTFFKKLESMVLDLGLEKDLPLGKRRDNFLPVVIEKEVAVTKIGGSIYLEKIAEIVCKLRSASVVSESCSTEGGSLMSRKRNIYRDLASLYDNFLFFLLNKGKNVVVVFNGKVYSLKSEKKFLSDFEEERKEILKRTKAIKEDLEFYKKGG